MRRNSLYQTDLRPAGPRTAPAVRPRRGFTLLEMMTAVGIILILLAIGVIGFRSLDASASKKETGTMLSNAQALLAELESTAGLYRIEGPEGVYARGEKILPGPQLQSPQNPSPPVRNPMDVVAGTATGDANRYGLAMRRTQDVIARLSQVPRNKAMLAQMPAKRLLGKAHASHTNGANKVVIHDSPPLPSNDPAIDLPVTPVLLDGWRNPLLFVPSGGLEGVKVGTQTVIVTTTGQRQKSSDPPNATDRPFWASAGPDGSFETGDDNLYSFDKQ